MAKIIFTGLCNGTVTKRSAKSGKDYQVTSFVDLSSDTMKTFDVFGDLGLVKDVTPREYQLDGQVVNLSGVKVLAGGKPVAK